MRFGWKASQGLIRSPFGFAALAVAVVLASVRPAAAQHPTPAASLEALSISEPIQVDGRLDEEVWSRAAVGSGFTQREKPEAPASERTEVMVAYTPTTLYIAFRCFDPKPDKIVAQEMEYDGRLFRDDSVIVVLDTFHDHRNAYFLETNPNGAQLDALSSDEGRSLNGDWDGVWSAASRVTPEGWTSEMAIPFATLRFDPTLDTWGFNVRRLVAHSNEQSYWMQVGRDATIVRMSRAGHLTGLHGLQPALNLRIKPHVVGSRTEQITRGTNDNAADSGVDLKWGITRGLALDLTYNTDFAEAEADDQLTNLTRFSLLLKEKREFFLENSGIFEVVPPSQLGGTPTLKLFNSRNIGIAPNGTPVPIRWGTRLTGRAGDWSLGFLDVSTSALGPTRSGVVDGIAPDNWGVFRLKRNIGQRSSLGLFVSNRDQEGGDSNQVYAFDADLNPLPKLNVNAYFAGSQDPSKSDWSGGTAAVWTGQYWIWSMEAMQIGKDFNPEAGFVLRSGVRRYAPSLTYKPRPALPGVRNLQFDVLGEVFTDLDNHLESLAGRVDLAGFVLDREDQASVFVDVNRERLSQFFAIRPGIFIQPGEYDFADVGITYATSPTRKNFYASGTLTQGQFYDGDRLSSALTLGLRASRYFRAETRWTRDDIDLPAGSFTANVWRERLSLSLSPRISTNAFIQYNDSAQLVSLNLRFNWIYRPGADLFVVYNENWDAPTLSHLTQRERQLIVKFTYLLEI